MPEGSQCQNEVLVVKIVAVNLDESCNSSQSGRTRYQRDERRKVNTGIKEGEKRGIKEQVQHARKRCRAEVITAKCPVYTTQTAYPISKTNLRYLSECDEIIPVSFS